MEKNNMKSDWYTKGWSVFKGTRKADYYPPINDNTAQREWLGGFGAAFAEYPDTAPGGELSVNAWLHEAVTDIQLYQQLLLHGKPKGHA